MLSLNDLPDLLSAYIAASLMPFGGVDPHVDWRDAFLMLLSPLFFAVVVAEWLRAADIDGRLALALSPQLDASERSVAEIEGWILGVE